MEELINRVVVLEKCMHMHDARLLKLEKPQETRKECEHQYTAFDIGKNRVTCGLCGHVKSCIKNMKTSKECEHAYPRSTLICVKCGIDVSKIKKEKPQVNKAEALIEKLSISCTEYLENDSYSANVFVDRVISLIKEYKPDNLIEKMRKDGGLTTDGIAQLFTEHQKMKELIDILYSRIKHADYRELGIRDTNEILTLIEEYKAK